MSTRSMEYKLSGMKTLMEGILAKVCEIKEELTADSNDQEDEDREPTFCDSTNQ